jgi:hypothetical protein
MSESGKFSPFVDWELWDIWGEFEDARDASNELPPSQAQSEKCVFYYCRT